MIETILNAMRAMCDDPEGRNRRTWQFDPHEQSWRFVDRINGTKTIYSSDAFKEWCLTVVDGGANNIPEDVVKALEARFPTLRFK